MHLQWGRKRAWCQYWEEAKGSCSSKEYFLFYPVVIESHALAWFLTPSLSPFDSDQYILKLGT